MLLFVDVVGVMLLPAELSPKVELGTSENMAQYTHVYTGVYAGI